MPNDQIGTLYVVATPIGNLDDITLRAVSTLKQVDRIIAEDTRHAMPLLKHLAIRKPILSMHEFNEHKRIALILEYLAQGESIALISDAGTPLISDPGFPLVREVKAQGHEVIPIPGACAAIVALSVAGLPTDRFVFEGFLPAKANACEQRLKTLVHETRTLIFYVAPHRLLDVLTQMITVLGPTRKAVIARELTKIYEQVLAMHLADLLQYYKEHTEELRGEVVLLVAGLDTATYTRKEVIPEEVLEVLLAELPLKQAANLASKITGERKNLLYEKALSKKG